MSPEVSRVPSDVSLAKVIETFVKRKIRRLFVTDQDAVLVGEIDIFELLRTLGEYVDPMPIHANDLNDGRLEPLSSAMMIAQIHRKC